MAIKPTLLGDFGINATIIRKKHWNDLNEMQLKLLIIELQQFMLVYQALVVISFISLNFKLTSKGSRIYFSGN